ncbi:MAG: uroporphyrinogen decarboxylase [Verrucomicrobiae bacterium]|nr:uroporphyrinogen decarboxylase [Verrucomicrobiae bacterium]
MTPLSSSPLPAPPGGEFSCRDRFLRACACQPVDRTPVWLMRQAGRVLPEYRALKERHSFLELVRTPELAAEVTLQPIRRFQFDAAIIFSDILVIPEAMGQGYHFADQGGIRMDWTPKNRADLDRLDPARARDHLEYVGAALRLVRRELDGRTALIGFCGSPWTLANFMLEGGSSPDFRQAHHLRVTDPPAYHALAERLTQALIEYLRLQCDAGADALQIFDTLAGLLPGDDYPDASGRWIREIVSALGHRVPIIVFSKGAHARWRDLVDTGAEVIGLGPDAPLAELRQCVPGHVGLQGNLDSRHLTATPEVVSRESRTILEIMRGRPGHIFNLGHGVPPDAPLENLTALVNTVRSFA